MYQLCYTFPIIRKTYMSDIGTRSASLRVYVSSVTRGNSVPVCNYSDSLFVSQAEVQITEIPKRMKGRKQMWGYEGFCCGFGWWWVFPIAMIIMCALCLVVMRWRRGFMMCGPFSRGAGDQFWKGRAESASEILDRRYAQGEIGKDEYEEKRRDIGRTGG